MATNRKTLADAVESPDLTGVLDLDAKGRPSLDDDREPLFKLGGVIYTVPKRVPSGISVEYLRLASIAGETIAVIYAMQRLISGDGYQALVQDSTLTATELGQITSAITAKVVDGFRLPKA